MHCHVGLVADFLVDPAMAGMRIVEGSESASLQASFQAINLALLTGPKVKELGLCWSSLTMETQQWQVVMLDNDFTHLLLQDARLESARLCFGPFSATCASCAIESLREMSSLRGRVIRSGGQAFSVTIWSLLSILTATRRLDLMAAGVSKWLRSL
jgi:hypothetical protein